MKDKRRGGSCSWDTRPRHAPGTWRNQSTIIYL